ncbi:ribonuclease D [Oscillatoria salina]|uniref:ribonuclease D n=1 Tax=Oscillatoria salina TaxID=331517 RepID=UPI0013BAD2BF|nr:ribonuclease D [Oscillatoria salina]MBZ8182631.1 ribonuclease D [Oscillatoria salina IIICB1]NET88347.1 ribonuclease D [Kamptonema sp. SIO1D9]
MQYLMVAEEIEAAIAQYSQKQQLWIDTEVADYNSKQPRLSLIQILDDPSDLNGSRVTILDILYQPELVHEFIEQIMLNSQIEKVFHNAQYDLNFLGKKQANNVTCTLEMAKKIPFYKAQLPNYQLKTLAEKLCNFPVIDKREQAGDWGQRSLTTSQLYYAKMDVVYLAQVHLKLLQLTDRPDPANEDIQELTNRYRQLEYRWKLLDTEIADLKNRLKAAMDAQKIKEVKGFKLSTSQRTEKKVTFRDLVKVAQAKGIDLDFAVKLDKKLQKDLGEAIEELPIEEKKTSIVSLRISEPEDDDDIPF